MNLDAVADAVASLEMPLNCDSIRRTLALIDVLDAKLAPAIDEVARSGEWELEGAVSMVAWLRHHGRMAGGAAKTMTKTAAAVAELPVTARAWESGELSTAQVRAICANVAERRIALFAEHEEAVVPALVPLTVAQTASAMALWRERADALMDDQRPERDSSGELSCSKTFEGRHELRGHLDAAPGEVVATALALATTKDSDSEVRTPKERRADALVAICQFFLDHQTKAHGGRHRPHLNVVIDIEDLPGGVGTFIDGSVAPSELIESLVCDSNLHRVLTTKRSAILEYGRSARTAPPDLFNALALRDGHCREPGCDRPPSWCDAHHVDVWDEGGETNISNLVLRCTRHHHQWHKRRKLGWTERLEPDGTLRITDPDGRSYLSYPDGPLAQRQLIAV